MASSWNVGLPETCHAVPTSFRYCSISSLSTAESILRDRRPGQVPDGVIRPERQSQNGHFDRTRGKREHSKALGSRPWPVTCMIAFHKEPPGSPTFARTIPISAPADTPVGHGAGNAALERASEVPVALSDEFGDQCVVSATVTDRLLSRSPAATISSRQGWRYGSAGGVGHCSHRRKNGRVGEYDLRQFQPVHRVRLRGQSRYFLKSSVLP
jgi:hypothetical protein